MKLLEISGSKLVIDCHSFSSIQNLLNRNPPLDIDICIGYNEDETYPNKTAIGNIVCQLLSRGVFSSVEEARACIFDSFSIKTFVPEENASI